MERVGRSWHAVGALVPLSKNLRARQRENKNEELAAAARIMNDHKINQTLASRICQRWVREALVPVRVVVREDAEVSVDGKFAPELTKSKGAEEGAAKGGRYNFKCLGRRQRATNIS